MNNLEKALQKVNCNNCNNNYCYIPITGPTGPAGNSSIKIGKTNTTTGNASVKNVGTDSDVILEFDIPKGNDGATGPTGPIGPEYIKMASIITYEDNYPIEGLEIKEAMRLPLTRVEIDRGNLIEFNNDDSFKFTTPGHYKVTIIVNAYVPQSGIYFDEAKDFVAFGLREENTDNIYIGGSTFTKDEISHTIVAQGLLSIVDTTKNYELVNLSKRSIYLKVPKLEDINTHSYFVNAPVNIIIEYLGRYA